ncbi:alpha/beta fold hydrolase [Streptomyces sp. FXJ1.4098]|nr:alpha/beta fold hydrolase [Streptomyces sp. FXJ1.4098]
MRLYCVPPSGAGSEFFLPWVAEFSQLIDLVAVQLPGRGNRVGEPSITDINWATAGIAEAMAADLSHRPPADGFYAVFGHSFGALLAFEATHRLRADLRTEPDLLALSAVPPPNHDGLDDHIARNLGSGIAAITEIMGWEEPTDDALTRTVYTPFLADAVALLQHTRQIWPTLRARLSVFGGNDDPMVDPSRCTNGARVRRPAPGSTVIPEATTTCAPKSPRWSLSSRRTCSPRTGIRLSVRGPCDSCADRAQPADCASTLNARDDGYAEQARCTNAFVGCEGGRTCRSGSRKTVRGAGYWGRW